MQTYPKNLTLIADRIVSKRLGNKWGTHTYSAYLDHLDKRTTAHLNEYMKAMVLRTAGKQRRRALFSFERGELLIHIPVNNIRTGQTLWVSVEFYVWLNLMEVGANNAWRLRYKHRHSPNAQISCTVMNGPGMRGITVALSRVIVGARGGQIVRPVDGNPLNLRCSNLRLTGSASNRSKRCWKYDREVVKRGAIQRAERIGAALGPDPLS